jgi:alpha-N-acetylglucosaminidase
MSLWGINMALAMTGQEEVQYKVFTQLGLSDSDIRHWFNGPAFLTWSRGQNEYGNNIAGPLPRSFMKNQWALQKQILARYRSLAITGQLPAFQGNVPIQLKYIQSDANITQQGGTGWVHQFYFTSLE